MGEGPESSVRTQGFQISVTRMFVGLHDLSIDDKHRISIPSSIRANIDPERDGTRFYIAPGQHENTLELFVENYFPTFVERMHESLEPGDDAENYETFFLSMSSLLEMDKQGRVLLPQLQLEYAGIGKQVTLMGRRDRLIMWNRDDARKFIEKGWHKYPEMRRLSERRNGRSKHAGDNGA